MKKRVLIFIALGVVLCWLCIGLVSLSAMIVAGARALPVLSQQYQELAQVRRELGTHPPDAGDAREALPAQVGSYTLNTESVSPVEVFYGFHVDDDAYKGTYSGPDEEIELTIIQARSPGGAANYVYVKLGWVDSNLSGTQFYITEPEQGLVLYSSPEIHGRTWNSQEWVISIEAETEETRDAFFEALSYR